MICIQKISEQFHPLENVVLKIANPSVHERADFFSPLFKGIAFLTPDLLKNKSEKIAKVKANTFSVMCMENATRTSPDTTKHNPETCLVKSDVFDSKLIY